MTNGSLTIKRMATPPSEWSAKEKKKKGSVRLRERTCFRHVSLKVLKEQQVPGGPFEKVHSGEAKLNAGLFDLGIEASSFQGE